jgi:ankyrin repeat protein
MKDTPNLRQIDHDLMIAASKGDLEAIDCLLLKGANPQAVIGGETALMGALGNRREQAVAILLKVSNIDQPARYGWTAMDHAVMMGNKSFVRRFMTPQRAKRKDKDGA